MSHRETFSRNGHEMEINVFYGQGGVLEDLYFWCHTCDPPGAEIPAINVMRGTEGAKHLREAQLELRKLAFQHSKEKT